MNNAFPIIIGIIIGVVATILIKKSKCCAMKKEGDKKDGQDKGDSCCGHKH